MLIPGFKLKTSRSIFVIFLHIKQAKMVACTLAG